MEIVFQNRLSDYEAFFDYMLTQTQEGKRFGERAYYVRQFAIFNLLVILGLVYWGITGRVLAAFVLAWVVFFLVAGTITLMTKLKPQFYFGKKAYRAQLKLLSERDLQFFQLPRTLTINDHWVEIRSSEAMHRWKWGLVDSIGMTSDFIFLHVGKCCIFYIPKRDFETEQSFLDLGKKLKELEKKNKGQPIGVGERP